MASNAQPITMIARLLDLTERRVQQLSREGVIPKAERGRYELVGAVRGYVRYLRELALKADLGTADYGAERARLVKARADLAEMEAAQRRGELVPAEEVQEAWRDIVARLRARILVIPDKIAPQLHETDTIAAAGEVVRRAIHEALSELAETEVTAVPPADRSSGAGGDGAGGAQGGDPAAGAHDQ